MSFEILSSSGEALQLSGNEFRAHSDVEVYFLSDNGHRYSAFFDGNNVIFSDDTVNYVGRWLQGSSWTVIRTTRRLSKGYSFTFMDHGPGPQRLHATWTFDGSLQESIAGWKLADFSVSIPDRAWNRNHPTSVHLRTKGAFATGADSSHVTIPVGQTGNHTTGEIHIGEFNPLTGFGIGFVLHHLEPWLSKRGIWNSYCIARLL